MRSSIEGWVAKSEPIPPLTPKPFTGPGSYYGVMEPSLWSAAIMFSGEPVSIAEPASA